MNYLTKLSKAMLIPVGMAFALGACSPKNETKTEAVKAGDFASYPIYEGQDLGLTYSPEKSVFKIWSPAAERVVLKLYKEGTGGSALETVEMDRQEKGVWLAELKGDQAGKFYTFQVTQEGKVMDETPGIYAKSVGVNGHRAYILDLNQTNPENWKADQKPELKAPNDIILYELHVRDITTHPSSGSSYPGKFLGLVEEGTKNPAGLSTGIDHMKEMGITHVHILPAFDYKSVDESKLDQNMFNWGYDPENYNVPEGSYSTDPTDPAARIKEFKQMVQGFHKNGIRVVMDVVYNHTGKTEDANFNLESPGYYYRFNEDGTFSNASGCGNETASDHEMMRKFIIESCKYWAEEYHVDGFRFDLMAIHDIETMNELSEELHKIDPTIFVYGEGWTAGGSPLADSKKALKHNTMKLDKVAAFSDDIRDGIKGSVFDEKSGGFVGGDASQAESIKFGVVGATEHPQLNYKKVNYSKAAWAKKPAQSINYVSCHDNHTLYDKLKIANEDASEAELKQMSKLSNAIVLTSQGIPFLHAGVEMLRTKGGEHNSYNKPDAVNQINWNWKTENVEVVNYYEGLIALRKAHPAFRMKDTTAISEHLEFIKQEPKLVVSYKLKDHANGDAWNTIFVAFNADEKAQTIILPKGEWKQVVNDQKAGTEVLTTLNGGKQQIPARSAMVLYQ